MTYKEILEACWTGYRQAGMKNKGGRQVPNCVPVSETELEENLRDWFKDKWVRFGPDGKIRGDCARGSSKEGKPKCLLTRFFTVIKLLLFVWCSLTFVWSVVVDTVEEW